MAEDISFDVSSCEMMGLIGPNGAGKTSLLNMISGIYSMDKGRIMFGDVDVSKAPAHKRARLGLARTFQAPRFLQRSNIRDNLLLGTDLADQYTFFQSFIGKKSKDFEEELSELMEIAGFTFDWDDLIAAFPYGRLKILEIVRAMLSKPRILLIDEPAAGLNDIEIGHAVALLKLATEKRGMGVVLIEHKMDMVMNNCHNIVVLNFGKVIAKGQPEMISKNKDVIEAYLGRGYDVAN
ncbi:MAG: ATP-binding cassette domain-containing protein [Synergistaceae bacterium]|nr:ATP-binding cassette domain-containing protein [Synergistaceae bacterium]